MDWIKNLNRALEHVENNILEDINHEEVANEAFSSKFHFLRVFSILTGKTLGEYIRERRLTLAAKEIIHGDKKVIDIAIKYGYDDPGAFTKAFKRFHGVTPTAATKSNNNLKATPPLKFIITVKGEEQMDYRIEKKEAFNVIGSSIDTTSRNGENYKAIPEFWQESGKNGLIKEVIPKIGSLGLLGICYNFNMDTEVFKYMIAVEGDRTSGKLEDKLTIPKHTWAIFPGKGKMPDSIQVLWKKIFNEWFPATNYEHATGPELEIYKSDADENGEEEFEIWVPVELKK